MFIQSLSLFTPLYLQYPKWIHPELFPGVPVLGLIRWYGLMYICAFVTAYLILKQVMKEGALNTEEYTAKEDDIFSFMACGIIFLLIGARVFSTLVYNTSGLYWKKPWLIFWPFDTETHQFTGLAGMSYHGGFIGGLIGMVVWCKKNKRPTLKWIDAMVLAIPLGYTFGRIGNFMNGELYGRITTMPWGMVFPVPLSERFPASQEWVQKFAQQIGMVIQPEAKLVNLPRHPSQLYEAFFEGFMLWLSMWFLRKHKPFDGFFAGFYTIGYGLVRFIIEYFREPDADLGYRISPTGDKVIYQNNSLLNISTGQILCFIMILGGTVFLITLAILNKKKKNAPATTTQSAVPKK